MYTKPSCKKATVKLHPSLPVARKARVFGDKNGVHKHLFSSITTGAQEQPYLFTLKETFFFPCFSVKRQRAPRLLYTLPVSGVFF